MQELSTTARAYFSQPRNSGAFDLTAPNVAAARVGEPASGAIVQLHLRIAADGTIDAARFQAYGCAWTIACADCLAGCLAGMTLAEAAQWRHHMLMEKLAVPAEKLHCAVLAETALKAALRNWVEKPSASAAVQAP